MQSKNDASVRTRTLAAETTCRAPMILMTHSATRGAPAGIFASINDALDTTHQSRMIVFMRRLQVTEGRMPYASARHVCLPSSLTVTVFRDWFEA